MIKRHSRPGWQKSGFAGKVVCFLAVLFCLKVTALSAGLALSFKNPAEKRISFKDSPAYCGLSIAFQSIPLLKVKPPFTRTFQPDESHNLVKVENVNGNQDVEDPAWLGLNQYLNFSRQKQVESLWQTKTQEITTTRLAEKKKGSLLQYEIPIKFPKLIKSLIGEGGPGLRVNGYRRISFSGKSTWVSGLKSTATSKQSKFPSLNMVQTSRFTIDGNIGSKIAVKVDQDSKRFNDLENNIQLRYNGEPEEIIQTIEAGNTNLQIGGARFVGYSQSLQGLFGFKSTAKLGGLDLTMIMSQEKGATQGQTFRAGARQDTFYIRDWNYLPRTFYYLGRGIGLGHEVNDFKVITDPQGNIIYRDSIVNIDLYVAEAAYSQVTENNENTQNLRWGVAYVDPTPYADTTIPKDTLTPEYRRGEYAPGKRFRRLTPDQDYYVSRTQYWIKLQNQLGINDVLAVYLEISRQDGRIDTIGTLDYGRPDTTYVLKLIKMENLQYHWFDPLDNNKEKPFVTWDYEWKNVYDLGVDNLDPENFKLNIYQGLPGQENIQIDKDSQDSIPYIRILGLDSFDLSGQNPVPDNKVDLRHVLIPGGYLVFPERLPFISRQSFTGDRADTLWNKPDSIYYSILPERRREATQYYIYFESSQRRNTYELNPQGILENSEVVKLNGRTLTRGSDYNINYEFGEITFLTEEALDPNADISVDYQSIDIIQAQKKSLYGIQGERVFSKNFGLRFNALYKNVKPVDTRPRIGNEPNRTFVWDVNFNSNFEPQLMTKLVDALPLFSTTAPSQLTLNGEVAQSISNPNIRDRIYMDDFEGIVNFTDLGVRRANWTTASPPVGKEITKRGKLIWYNPYNQVPIKEIWPNREAGRNQERVNVLSLKFDPQSAASAPESSWAGIMRTTVLGSHTQSNSKYLEIWVQIDKGKNNPVLHVDLGEISEDINDNDSLDTEDQREGGVYYGILDAGEDVGIDGIPNNQEPGYDGNNNPDPNGDNWDYNSSLPDEVSYINGTENNAADPDRGRIPDTEDINRSQGLDQLNRYFSFAIDLDDSTYFVPGTESGYGWRLYRVPLRDSTAYTVVNNPIWSNITYARLWLSEADTLSTISIAEIKLVGNRWQTLPYDTLAQTEFFDVAAKSTHEHPDYVPPPGVAGKYDPSQNFREAEQSLALIYKDINPGRIYYAYRNLFKAENYTNYGRIKMFVHGPENPDPVQFFYRLGQDSTNFYEYHTNIYSGWDGRNWVDLDFATATALKIKLQELRKSAPATFEITEGNYRVKGNPSLSQIKWLAVGIKNADTLQTISGEIWVDEMTSTDVRKEPGWAMQATSSLVFADLLRLSTSFYRTDTEFHNLRDGPQENRGSGVTTTSFSLDGNLEAHKFLPPNWEMTLPIRFGYSKSLTVPRLIRGTDIILPEELRHQQRSESTRKNYQITPRFNKNTKNWLLNWTLKRISFSYNKSIDQSYSVNLPVNKSSGYGTSFGYDATLGRQVGLPFFKWASSLGVPKSLAQAKFGVFPRTLRFSGSIGSRKVHSVSNTGVVTNTFERGFQGNADAQMDLLKGIPLSYTYRSTRDLRNNADIRFSLNPKKAKFGIETSMGETFSTSYSPNWFKFLTQSFSYRAGYNENPDPKQNIGGTRRLTNNSSYGINGSFNFTFLLNKLLPQPKAGQPVASDTTQKEAPKKDTPQKGTPQKKSNPIGGFFKGIISIPKNINPISYSYSKDRNFSRNGLLERPSLWYRLGFQTQTDVPRISDINPIQSTSEGSSMNQRFGLKSGVSLFGSINTSFGYSSAKGITQGTGGPRFRRGVNYPEFGLQWSKVKIPFLLNKFFSNASYQFRYEHSIEESGNQRTKEVEDRKTSNNFSPLAGIALNWKNGITSSIRVDKSKTEGKALRSGVGGRTTTVTENKGVAVTSNYSFSSPKGITIPLLGRLKFQSNLNVSFDVSWRTSITRRETEGLGFSTLSSSSEFSVSPRGSYNFSSQINGGFQARWSDRQDRKTGYKTHYRELGIWAEIRF